MCVASAALFIVFSGFAHSDGLCFGIYGLLLTNKLNGDSIVPYIERRAAYKLVG